MSRLGVKGKHLVLGLVFLLLWPAVIAAEYGDDLTFFSPQTCSMEFRDADVKNVLRSLAEPYKINLLVSRNVSGTITASFDNVYVKDVFIAVLRDAGLDYVREGNILRVDTFESLENKKKLAPLVTRSMEVTYAFDSSQTKDLSELAGQLKRMLSGRSGSEIVAIPRTNTLLITDVPEYVDKIMVMVKELDKEAPQITIFAKIVTMDTDYSKELGIQWGGKLGTGSKYLDVDGNINKTLTAQGGTLTAGEGGGGGGGGEGEGEAISISGENFAVNLPAVAMGSLNVLIGKIGGDILEVQLSAMESEGKGSILSNPKVITQDNQMAKIESGVEIPYQVVEEGGGYKIEFKKAVVSLKVTPHVIGNNVFMDITVSKDAPGTMKLGMEAIPIDTNELTTKVLVANGETVVVGGLIEQTKTNSTDKVPFLSEIPLLGWLFKKKAKVNDKKELLIFITPSIMEKG